MIKFNRVNGWTYKTEDNQYLVYNAGPNEWYSAKVDADMVAEFGYTTVVAIDSTKVFHYSIKDAQSWIREVNYKQVA